MKICFPVLSLDGLESPLSEHFGKAPAQIIVDNVTNEIVADTSSISCEGNCAPIDWMIAQGVQAVIVGNLGRGALNRLQQAGIGVAHSDAQNVGAALEAFEAGECVQIGDNHVCSGHHD